MEHIQKLEKTLENYPSINSALVSLEKKTKIQKLYLIYGNYKDCLPVFKWFIRLWNDVIVAFVWAWIARHLFRKCMINKQRNLYFRHHFNRDHLVDVWVWSPITLQCHRFCLPSVLFHQGFRILQEGWRHPMASLLGGLCSILCRGVLFRHPRWLGAILLVFEGMYLHKKYSITKKMN